VAPPSAFSTFPYTTLFRSMVVIESIAIMVWTTDTRTVNIGYLSQVLRFGDIGVPLARIVAAAITLAVLVALHLFLTRTLTGAARSEEHTSELQSRENLVCR